MARRSANGNVARSRMAATESGACKRRALGGPPRRNVGRGLLLLGLFLLGTAGLGLAGRLLGRGGLLLATEDGVVALAEVLGLGEADADNAHEWSSLNVVSPRSPATDRQALRPTPRPRRRGPVLHPSFSVSMKRRLVTSSRARRTP